MKFILEHTREQRIAESARIKLKYPDRVPVICEKAENSQIEVSFLILRSIIINYTFFGRILTRKNIWCLLTSHVANLSSSSENVWSFLQNKPYIFSSTTRFLQQGRWWIPFMNKTKIRMVFFMWPILQKVPSGVIIDFNFMNLWHIIDQFNCTSVTFSLHFFISESIHATCWLI